MDLLSRNINMHPYSYDQQKVSDLLARVIRENTSAEAWEWLNEKGSKAHDAAIFTSAFMQTPRKVNRRILVIKEEDAALVSGLTNGFTVQGWTTDRLCRVWLLLQLDATDKERYTRQIENLFDVAEMNEQVALYSALPSLAYPQHWQNRCSEGIRSNIGDVLQAIMCRNPYPAAHLEEAAWNQMVLKAFFTEKRVKDIIGLDERSNPELANTLLDYAHERWAAHRSVNPQLWRCVGKFINDKNFPDIQRLFQSENETERAAAALACNDSSYVPAKMLLNENKQLKQAIENGILTWNTLP
jgi:hypothetical protein